MPLPSPAQILYGSVTVICTTFPLLLLAPEASPVTAALIAVGSLTAGLLVAVVTGRRRTSPPTPATIPAVRAGQWAAAGPVPTVPAELPQPADHAVPAGAAGTVPTAPAHAAHVAHAAHPTHAVRRSGVSV